MATTTCTTAATTPPKSPTILPHDTSAPASSSASSSASSLRELEQVAASYTLTQKPISVTLDGPTICGLSLTLVLLVHFLEPPVAELLIILAPVFIIIQNDYNNFIGLGPGGTPSTFRGYMRIAWLRLWALQDPYAPPSHNTFTSSITNDGSSTSTSTSTSSSHASEPATRKPSRGILRADPKDPGLPYRLGPRPLVAGIAPQRQLDQHGTQAQYLALRRTLEDLAARHAERFGTAKSCFEKHGLGLFARHPVNVTCNGEVCHVHDSDHSLHMCLHPEDIGELLAKGWGQRHPLARKGWFGAMPVPEEFVMVYAPRDDQELGILFKIVEAAVWFATAERTEIAPPQ